MRITGPIRETQDMRRQQAWILPSHLCFAVGTHPLQLATSPQFGHLGVELMCQDYGERHELRCFIRGVAEHHALITCTHVFIGTAYMHTLCYVRALLLDGNLEHTMEV